MKFYLQFGYGMMALSRELVERWGGGAVILSPRDLDDDQVARFGTEVTDLGGEALVDPQLYLPHSSHERLCEHAYWPDGYDTGTFWTGPALPKMLGALVDLNRAAGASRLILPGLFAQRVDADWFASQSAVIEGAAKAAKGVPQIGTLALSSDALRDADQVGELLEQAEKWPLKAFYVVCEHPDGDYLVSDPIWLANMLDLIAGLRLQGSEVILGYSNHQMLAAATVKVSAIASGTWMNVRAFPPEKFEPNFEEEIKQRATWYYCPQALSEYKIPFLDIAHRQKLLRRMAAPKEIGGEFAAALFSGAQPSTAGFTERQAFQHYLDCLRAQALRAEAATFDETVEQHEEMLDGAESLLTTLRAGGVMGQMRDFAEIIDVNRSALAVLKTTRGPMLRRKWSTLR